jgi:hypothetical protein
VELLQLLGYWQCDTVACNATVHDKACQYLPYLFATSAYAHQVMVDWNSD